MTDPYVTVDRNGPVALVTFDRHKNLNAFDGQLILELTEVARSFHDDRITDIAPDFEQLFGRLGKRRVVPWDRGHACFLHCNVEGTL